LEVNEARRLRKLEDENGPLKKIVAQQALDIECAEGGAIKKSVSRPTKLEACGGARRSKTERAARLWAAADAPGECRAGEENAGHSVANTAAGNRGRTSAFCLPAGA